MLLLPAEQREKSLYLKKQQRSWYLRASTRKISSLCFFSAPPLYSIYLPAHTAAALRVRFQDSEDPDKMLCGFVVGAVFEHDMHVSHTP
jgi:hypothetical protein